MFFKQLFALLITVFNLSMAQATENMDYITSLFPEVIALGNPCDNCIPTVVRCESYIETPSIKICLPLRYDDEDIVDNEITVSKEVVSVSQKVSSLLDYTILEQIDGSNGVDNTVILQELY